jgi:hypothetical protein
MRIKIALNEDIINECLALHYGKQISGKRARQRLVLIPIVLVSISAYLIYTELQQSVPGQNFYLAFLYIAFALSYYFFMRKRLLKGGKQLLKGLGENAFFEMEVDEDKLITYTLSSTLTTAWSELTRGIISRDNVLLYQSDNSFTMFNYRFFEGNDFDLFKTWTKEKVNPVTEVEAV